MNPTDFLLLLMSLGVAAGSIFVHGWTVDGIGPAGLILAGGLWHLWMQWLRHRSWVRHRDSGFAPGTQYLALSAIIGYGLGVTGALIWLLAIHGED
jgi:hypothetical protein